MQRLANWLIARPLNTVLGLGLSLLLPLAQVLSGALLVTIVLAQGVQRGALMAGAALLLLAAIYLAVGDSVMQLSVGALQAWLPAVILAAVLQRTRSLTLTLQVSVLIAALVTLGFFVVLGNPLEFWSEKLLQLSAVFAELGLQRQASALAEQTALIAPQMTMLFVLVSWSFVVFSVVLGYALYQRLPDAAGRFGRYCDVNLGRVLAFVMAAVSLLALVSNTEWLQNLAFVMFAVFWVQGLAILHWLHTDGPLPVLALIVVYAMLPVLNILLVTALALLGYTDAWFDYRLRVAARRSRK